VLAFGAAAAIERRRGRNFGAALFALLALLSAALGLIVLFACAAQAPYSMGLGTPLISATQLTRITCLGQSASTSAYLWTIATVGCGIALGLVSGSRRNATSAAAHIFSYAGAALLLLLAGVAGLVWFFDFSWCTSRRLF
jgi:hypothetical protein